MRTIWIYQSCDISGRGEPFVMYYGDYTWDDRRHYGYWRYDDPNPNRTVLGYAVAACDAAIIELDHVVYVASRVLWYQHWGAVGVAFPTVDAAVIAVEMGFRPDVLQP